MVMRMPGYSKYQQMRWGARIDRKPRFAGTIIEIEIRFEDEPNRHVVVMGLFIPKTSPRVKRAYTLDTSTHCRYALWLT